MIPGFFIAAGAATRPGVQAVLRSGGNLCKVFRVVATRTAEIEEITGWESLLDGGFPFIFLPVSCR
ncbi:hypothetical protein, partial [Zhihengliuella halotolerans]|uniref:hypothetical protein n=1 Tax=Zhihengliuella halotolerans TaxID=370736 RepID=UPI001CA4A91A